MGFKLFSKHFPPPKFLKPSHIGISFSDSSIKAIWFDKNSIESSFTSASLSIDEGSIVDGSVVRKDELIKKLSSLRKNFDSPFVFFTLPDEISYVFSVSVPTVGNDLTEAVTFVIEENVPLSLNEAVFDFTPTGIVKADSEYIASVAVAACPKKEIEKFIEVFDEAGFEPVGCVHESQAIAKAITPKNSSEIFSIVHARENRVGIYLVKNEVVHFSTVRSVSDKDYKRGFLDEYEKFLEFSSKYGEKKDLGVKSILVCGEFLSVQKIVEAVNESPNISKNAELSNVWTNVFDIDKHIPEIPFEKSLGFAGSIGATLSDII